MRYAPTHVRWKYLTKWLIFVVILRHEWRMRYAPTLVRWKYLTKWLILVVIPRHEGRMRYAPTLVRWKSWAQSMGLGVFICWDTTRFLVSMVLLGCKMDYLVLVTCSAWMKWDCRLLFTHSPRRNYHCRGDGNGFYCVGNDCLWILRASTRCRMEWTLCGEDILWA